MKKFGCLLALFACLFALPAAAADEVYPRYVVSGAKADLYPDEKLADKASCYKAAVSKGDVLILQGKGASGNLNVRTLGVDGWIKPIPFTEATLAACTGVNVNVRSAPKTGAAHYQFSSPETVLVVDNRNTGDNYPWYKVAMANSENKECWVYGQYLSLCLPIEESVATEINYLRQVAEEIQDLAVDGLPLAGIERGVKVDGLNEAIGLLRGAGWALGPTELYEGETYYVGRLVLATDSEPTALIITEENGVISDIRFSGQLDWTGADE